jgi:hypothetical protein
VPRPATCARCVRRTAERSRAVPFPSARPRTVQPCGPHAFTYSGCDAGVRVHSLHARRVRTALRMCW